MTEHREEREIEALIASWDARTRGLAPERASVPLHVLLGDAVDLAAFVETHYAPTEVDGTWVPGLCRVASESGVTRETARELVELQRVVASLHAAYETRAIPPERDPRARAERILSELRAGLTFLLEDGRDEEGLGALARLRDAGRTCRSHDALALLLEGFVSLAARYEVRLERVGVPSATLDDALEAAARLRARSADRIRVRALRPDVELLATRNRCIAALNERMRRVRRTIRYVFRDHPALARQATSAYFRRRASSSSETTPTSPVAA